MTSTSKQKARRMGALASLALAALLAMPGSAAAQSRDGTTAKVAVSALN
jgi:hypothetical protein